MLTVQPTYEQKAYAWGLANSKTYGRRGHFDGPPVQQYAGLLGETVLADMLC